MKINIKKKYIYIYIRTWVSLFIWGFCRNPRAISQKKQITRVIPNSLGPNGQGQELFPKILGHPQNYS